MVVKYSVGIGIFCTSGSCMRDVLRSCFGWFMDHGPDLARYDGVGLRVAWKAGRSGAVLNFWFSALEGSLNRLDCRTSESCVVKYE